MSTSRTLYIAGPMTGLPEHNFPAFHAAHAALVEAGHKVYSPARHGKNDPDKTWSDYMRRDIADLMQCDGVAMLDGWLTSRGASLEFYIANELGIKCANVKDWL